MNKTTIEEKVYINFVNSRLMLCANDDVIEDLNEGMYKDFIKQHYNEGWEVIDLINYICLTSQELNEAYAIQRMKIIIDKYKDKEES